MEKIVLTFFLFFNLYFLKLSFYNKFLNTLTLTIMNETTNNPEKKLREAYDQAILNKKKKFNFGGAILDVRTASYLLELASSTDRIKRNAHLVYDVVFEDDLLDSIYKCFIFEKINLPAGVGIEMTANEIMFLCPETNIMLACIKVVNFKNMKRPINEN